MIWIDCAPGTPPKFHMGPHNGQQENLFQTACLEFHIQFRSRVHHPPLKIVVVSKGSGRRESPLPRRGAGSSHGASLGHHDGLSMENKRQPTNKQLSLGWS